MKRVSFLDRFPDPVRANLMEIEHRYFRGKWDKCRDTTLPGDDAITVAFFREKCKVAEVSMSWDSTGEPTCTTITLYEGIDEVIEPWQA